uniref:Uncharacterized protein n=1 Tax=Caenorhabditis japonica TaxID=281687 RepID=A0A8R1EK68_CAEJA
MADDEDDIVWIRDEEPTSPTTPATVIEATPTLMDAFERKSQGPPEVTVSAPEEKTVENLSLPSETDQKQVKNVSNPPEIVEKPVESENVAPITLKARNSEDGADNSISFDISECERNFNKAIREANDILEDFDKKSQQVVENTKIVAKELAELAAEAPKVFQKTIDDRSQVPIVSELPSGGYCTFFVIFFLRETTVKPVIKLQL